MTDHQVFNLPDLTLQSGVTCPDASLVYKTYGELAPDKSNVIVYPSAFGGRHMDMEWIVAEGRPMDPTKYFIVIMNMFGNGLSTSPSNATAPLDRAQAPQFTIYDNVMAQQRLLREVFGIERIALVFGRSMGAIQAFHWGALFPEQVARICCICGAARPSPHNQLFLQGLWATLTADENWKAGWFEDQPQRGLLALARVYAGWAMSQAFYREETWRDLDYASMEEFVVARWEGFLQRHDANDILAMFWSWQHADISANEIYKGDFDGALGAIQAKALIMPSRSDLYFRVEDNRREVARMPNAELRPIESIWGHMAGSWPEGAEDGRFIDEAVHELLAS
ncbi:MAG: alpha/beta fold hydrolase [Rhodospirillaceae bacterium]|jgi:homoserine O-acetyltransferase/O-succinyltransferase|nr:alpha/beta fold hydrolase [Rhodospirillaceae bacterium]MBT4490856.1 alpha/beta fold hydrolase [Rhodospirillaceae bacterium]MBT5194514.1 alpha/beta fold hydrolase [Rhodospirillaceae bacterium]MBT5899246.1 alpha/beta fold hydrolase [Rhodospirillaceae bacterium]MBT6427860.1 alpha/beta fold hydrolase [Rhodospirillaceae bacterium]